MHYAIWVQDIILLFPKKKNQLVINVTLFIRTNPSLILIFPVGLFTSMPLLRGSPWNVASTKWTNLNTAELLPDSAESSLKINQSFFVLKNKFENLSDWMVQNVDSSVYWCHKGLHLFWSSMNVVVTQQVVNSCDSTLDVFFFHSLSWNYSVNILFCPCAIKMYLTIGTSLMLYTALTNISMQATC